MKRSLGQRTASFMLLVALILGLALTMQQPVPTVEAAGTWDTAAAITSGASHAVNPDVVIDSQGVSHVVWTNTDFSSYSIAYYSNNRNGNWRTPMQVFTSIYTYADFPKITTATVNGQVRVAVVAKVRSGDIFSNRVGFRQSLDGGVTWAQQEEATITTSFEPDVVLDDTGQPHVSYTEINDGNFYVYYRTKINGSWTARGRIGATNNSYHNYSSIAYTRVNGELGLHVMLMGSNGSELSKSVYYVNKMGAAAWSNPKLVRGNGSNFPDLEANPTTGHLFAAFQSFTSDFEAFVATSTNMGASWSMGAQAQTSGLDARPGLGRTPSDELAVAWDTDYQGKSEIDGRVFEAGGWGSRQRLINAAGFSKEVEVAGGVNGFMAVWHDSQLGNFRIFFSTYEAVGGPSVTPIMEQQAPSDLLGATLTGKTEDISATMTLLKADPTEVRYAWGAAPTNANPWVSITETTTLLIDAPSNLDTSVCTKQRLYVQARNASYTGTIFNTDEIVIDGGVQSKVVIKSPLTSNKAVDYPTAGHEDFIRTPDIIFNVGQEPSGCAGVARFVGADGVEYTQASALGVNHDLTLDTTGWITEGAGFEEIDIPVAVTVTDKVSDTAPHTEVFSKVLHYDDDAPVLVSSTGMTATNSGGDSPIATINLADVQVTDNSYDQYVSDSNKAYWGMWVFVSKNDLGSPTPETFLQYKADVFELEEGRTTAQIYLNRGGVDSTDPGRDPGPRFIYIRFLDGAGNFTGDVIKLPAQLNEGYASNTSFMPVLNRQ